MFTWTQTSFSQSQSLYFYSRKYSRAPSEREFVIRHPPIEAPPVEKLIGRRHSTLYLYCNEGPGHRLSTDALEQGGGRSPANVALTTLFPTRDASLDCGTPQPHPGANNRIPHCLMSRDSSTSGPGPGISPHKRALIMSQHFSLGER